MKTKIIYFLAIAAITIFIRISSSQTLFTEDFSYPPLSNIVGMNGWLQGYAPNPNNPIPVISQGLTFTNYPGSGIGNCVLVRNDTALSMCIRKEFTEQTSGSIYMSFMLRVDSLTASATEDFLLCLDKGGSASDYRNTLYVKKYNASTYFVGIKKVSTVSYSPVLLNKNQTYLIVTKYKFTAGGSTNDSVSLFIIPAAIPVNEPAADQVSYAGTDSPGLGEIQINNHAYGQLGNGLRRSSVKIDGIKIAKSWGETVLTAIQQTSIEIPESFELGQNYPNPFNPVTNIKFRVPKGGFVNLKLYDITGKETATLVDENLNAGTYNYDLDASGLSSGTYFYRLTSGEFTETKKMILVK